MKTLINLEPAKKVLELNRAYIYPLFNLHHHEKRFSGFKLMNLRKFYDGIREIGEIHAQ